MTPMPPMDYRYLVTSWRTGTSQQAQDDLDSLLEPALKFAEQQLNRRGAFFPYAVARYLNGEVEMVSAPAETLRGRPVSEDVVLGCRSILASRIGNLCATGIIADVRLPGREDGIRVELEHSEGPALCVVLPYTRNQFTRSVKFGSLQTSLGRRYLWT